ncbi:TauD/TfdA family dioxygenase [Paractinoplanes durhamensis]|uniref:TauD/TfdA family dioxygenase n=1 Tax=Paractinoplanes durhamensis TaxID=113563 RepID=UPI0019435A48
MFGPGRRRPRARDRPPVHDHRTGPGATTFGVRPRRPRRRRRLILIRRCRETRLPRFAGRRRRRPARDALAAVIKAVDGSMQDVRLSAGEILIIDNLRSVHGRRPFTARYDGRDRWLRIVQEAADLRRSEGLRTGDHGRAVIADLGLVDR